MSTRFPFVSFVVSTTGTPPSYEVHAMVSNPPLSADFTVFKSAHRPDLGEAYRDVINQLAERFLELSFPSSASFKEEVAGTSYE